MSDYIEMLNWAERSAMDNLRSHLDNITAIKRETVTTLSVLFAAAAGCVLYVSQHYDGHGLSAACLGALFAAVWLYAACVVLTVVCMAVKDAPALANLGRSLVHKDCALYLVKEVEIKNIDERSEQARARSVADSNWLNRVRLAALATPLLFVIGYSVGPTRSFASAAAEAPPVAVPAVPALPHPATAASRQSVGEESQPGQVAAAETPVQKEPAPVPAMAPVRKR